MPLILAIRAMTLFWCH